MSTVDITDIIKLATETEGLSDIHLAPGIPPMARVYGTLAPCIEGYALTDEDTDAMAKALMGEDIKVKVDETGGADFSVRFEERIFRVNVSNPIIGKSVTMRLIPGSVASPTDLGVSKAIMDIVSRPQGLFLVTGATGSGKSTTLASLLTWIAQQSAKKIVTVEQPTEYPIQHHKSVVTQFDVPRNVPTFADALRFAMRQDPDVIMVGELRDLETMRTAIRAAETGHIVLSTMHTNSAKDSVSRMCNSFEANEQNLVRMTLADVLLGVMSQVLVPRADTAGRVMAYELMVCTHAIRNRIRKSEEAQIENELQTGSKHGMQLLDDHLYALAEGAYVSSEAAINNARDSQRMRSRLSATEVSAED